MSNSKQDIGMSVVASGRVVDTGASRSFSGQGCTLAYIGVGQYQVTLKESISPDRLYFKSSSDNQPFDITLDSYSTPDNKQFAILTSRNKIPSDASFFMEFCKLTTDYIAGAL